MISVCQNEYKYSEIQKPFKKLFHFDYMQNKRIKYAVLCQSAVLCTKYAFRHSGIFDDITPFSGQFKSNEILKISDRDYLYYMVEIIICRLVVPLSII